MLMKAILDRLSTCISTTLRLVDYMGGVDSPAGLANAGPLSVIVRSARALVS